MKILHTSDWHLGISVHGVSMLDEQRHFKDELIEIIKNNGIDAVIVSGDIFDSSVASSEAIRLYNDIATSICLGLNIPLIVIAGNHDGAARLSSMHELLKKSGLYITGKLTKDIEPLMLNNAAVYPIPHFNLDEVRALFPDEDIKTYEAAMNVVCSHIRDKIDKSLFNIAASHAFVSGAALSDSDHSAIIGTASMVSKDVFTGFDYVALGHLHKPQSVSDTVRYSGSPVKYSFSEANTNKSLTVIDTESGKTELIPLTPIHDMRIINGKMEEILSAPSSDDYIKAEITDKYAGLEALDALSAVFPNLLAVSGKSAADSEMTALSIDEMEKLSPSEILESFFMDTYGEKPEEEQIKMFEDALIKAEEGGGLE